MVETLKRPCAVVTGASGQIGWFATPRLAKAGFAVIAVSRRGRPEGFPELDAVTWVLPGRLPKAGRDATVLLSAGPLALAENLVNVLPGLRRIIAFSTTSVWSKAESADGGERAEIRAIIEAEQRLQAACGQRGIDLCLLRPPLVYGCGLDENISRLAALIGRFRWFPVAGAATGLRQPVHADDLAAAAVALFSIHAAWPEELTLCGGSTLSYLEMLERVASAIGRQLRPVRLPPGLLMLALRGLRRVHGLGGLTPEMLRRQGRDLVFNDAPARTLLNWQPRPFHPTADDFERPKAARLLALAGQSGERRAG